MRTELICGEASRWQPLERPGAEPPHPGQRSQPHQQGEHQKVFLSRTRPKILWSGVGGNGDRRTLMEDFSCGFTPQLIPLLLQGMWGGWEVSHWGQSISSACVGILGVPFAKLCRSLLSSWPLSLLHRHLWLWQCFLQTEMPLTWTGKLSSMHFLFHNILRHPLWDNSPRKKIHVMTDSTPQWLHTHPKAFFHSGV